MPRYLSPRKAAKYKELIEKLARILNSNKYNSFLIEGPREALYDDLWTIRSTLFSPHSSRFRFKKQFNGVWIEVLAPFSTDIPIPTIDTWDGDTIEAELTRGGIASKLILDKPSKVRFALTQSISEVDLEKLAKVAVANEYHMLVNDGWISFTKILTTPQEESTV